MFGHRRAAPSPGGAPSPAHTKPALAVPRRPAAPGPSSPLSSVPPSSSPQPPTSTSAIRTTTVLRTVVSRVAPTARAPPAPAVRTLNAYKRPADALPRPAAPPAAKRAVHSTTNGRPSSKSPRQQKAPGKRASAATSSSSDDNNDQDRPRSSRPRLQPPSSDLDPLTPSEAESDSDLSSVDEDYFAKTLTKEEGAPVCARPVAAHGAGPTDGKSGESLVLHNRTAYKEHFVDPRNPEGPTREWAGSDIPTVELEYPGEGVRERFALLAPRSDDEYNPIEDVLKVILTVLDHFLTKEEAFTHFGHLTGATSFAAFLYNRSGSSASHSRAGTPSATAANPAAAAAAAAREASAPTDSSPPSPSPSLAIPLTLPSDPAPAPTPPLPPPTSPPPPLIRELEKARAKRDGPAFLAAVARYNTTLSALKTSGLVARNIAAMKGLRERVWTKVFHQCYDRTVGPEIDRLREYEAFSDNVYGELLPNFMNEIFQKTHLGPNSVFVDLGSGVGNCVVQAALATGATAYGFENMVHASHLARMQVAEAERRFRMWGLAGGPMRVVEADFTTCAEVGEVLRRADVVLVNNEVFTAPLNQSLSWLFLELPPHARIVSLKPFLPDKFHLSAHNVNSPLAILNQAPALRYRPGSVSWKREGGAYYLTRVDRARVERFQVREREREERRRRAREERKERRREEAGLSSGSRSVTPAAGAGAGAGAMSRGPSRQG